MSLESPTRPKAQISLTYIVLTVASICHLSWFLPAIDALHKDYDMIDAMQAENAAPYTQTIALAKGSPAIVLMKDNPFGLHSRWAYISWRHPLSNDYQPVDLEALHVPAAVSTTPMRVAPIVNKALVKMFAAAARDGMPLIISSAYRSNHEQKVLYDQSVLVMGQNVADDYVARPGESEHATGLAVDINTYTEDCKIGLTLCSINESTAAWLRTNAPTYGFILRYPEGKKAITGVAGESWHYRFVGNGAEALTASGLTFEELVQKVSPELID